MDELPPGESTPFRIDDVIVTNDLGVTYFVSIWEPHNLLFRSKLVENQFVITTEAFPKVFWSIPARKVCGRSNKEYFRNHYERKAARMFAETVQQVLLEVAVTTPLDHRTVRLSLLSLGGEDFEFLSTARENTLAMDTVIIYKDTRV